jgi:hypothetical protein
MRFPDRIRVLERLLILISSKWTSTNNEDLVWASVLGSKKPDKIAWILLGTAESLRYLYDMRSNITPDRVFLDLNVYERVISENVGKLKV